MYLKAYLLLCIIEAVHQNIWFIHENELFIFIINIMIYIAF